MRYSDSPGISAFNTRKLADECFAVEQVDIRTLAKEVSEKRKEKKISRFEPLLQRLAIELSIYARDRSKRLDVIFDQSRNSPRQQAISDDELKVSPEQLFKYLSLQADGDNETELADQLAGAGKLLELIDELDLPDSFSGELHVVRTSLTTISGNDELMKMIDEVTHLLTRVNHFTLKSSNISNISEPGKFVAQNDLGRESALVSTLKPVLTGLPEQVAAFEDVTADIQEIRARPGNVNQVPDIKQILENIEKLLNKAASRINRDREGNEHFLDMLKTKLAGMEEGISGFFDEENLGDAEAFHREINLQVCSIRNVVNTGEDMDKMKEVIRRRVDIIGEGLDRRLKVERQKFEETQTRIDDLNSRLRAMEAETESLRLQVQEMHLASIIEPLTAVFNLVGYDTGILDELTRNGRINHLLSMNLIDIDQSHG